MPDVAYRSGGPLMNDIVAGHLPVGWTSTASAMPHMGTGRVRVLAVSTATRTPFFPDVPTVQEQGVADFDLAGWVALLGPARPAGGDLRAHAAAPCSQAYADAALRAPHRAWASSPTSAPPAALLAAMQREDRIWAGRRRRRAHPAAAVTGDPTMADPRPQGRLRREADSSSPPASST